VTVDSALWHALWAGKGIHTGPSGSRHIAWRQPQAVNGCHAARATRQSCAKAPHFAEVPEVVLPQEEGCSLPHGLHIQVAT
jgi:hypothetical protein